MRKNLSLLGILFFLAITNVSAQKSLFDVIKPYDIFNQDSVVVNNTRKFSYKSNTSKSQSNWGNDPKFNWVKTYGGSFGNIGNDIVMDNEGFLYITGYFSGIDTFPNNTILQSIGTKDFFVSKFDTLGNLIWISTASCGTNKQMIGNSLVTNSSGDIYVTGSFGGSQANFSGTFINSSKANTLFIAKYSNTGALQMLLADSCSEFNSGNKIAIDDSSNFYVVSSHKYNDVEEYKVLKFDSLGNIKWTINNGAKFKDLKISENKIFFVGDISTTIEFNAITLPFSEDYQSPFVASSNLNGVFEWAKAGKSADGWVTAETFSIEIDVHQNIYILGDYSYGKLIFGTDTLPEAQYEETYFLVKFDSLGNFLWAGTGNAYQTHGYQASPSLLLPTKILLDSQSVYVVVNTNIKYEASDFIVKYNSLSGGFIGGNMFEKTTLMGAAIKNHKIYTTGRFINIFDSTLTMLAEIKAPSDFGLTDVWLQAHLDDEGLIYFAGQIHGYSYFHGVNILDTGVYVGKFTKNGDALWVKTLQGNFVTSSGTTTDKFGNVYNWGSFTNSIKIGSIVCTNDNGVEDGYLAKFDSNGNILWLKHLKSFDVFGSGGIVTDKFGNVIIAGTYMDTLNIDGSIIVSNSNSYDAFVAKFSTIGGLVWLKSYGGSSYDRGRGICVDANSNTYVSGYFMETVDFGVQTLTSNGSSKDAFLLKINNSGVEQWVNKIGGTRPDEAWSCGTDNNGNILINGICSRDVVFGNDTLHTSMGRNSFIAKYDNNGNYLWSKAIENIIWLAYQLGIDNMGNVYIAGIYGDSLIMGSGITLLGTENNSFAAKYSPLGNLLWAKTILCWPSYIDILAIDVVHEDSIILGGRYFEYQPSNFDAIFVPNKNYCSAFIASMVKDSTTVNDYFVPTNAYFTVYPNPTNSVIKLRFDKHEFAPCRFYLYDITGKTIMDKEVSSSADLTIDLSNFQNGIYISKVKIGNTIHHYKVILNK